jgi:HAD superfamily hydrolase (TIGR01509 family)
MTSSVPTVQPIRPNGAGPAAVLLDMDGTLVDTEGFWWAAESEVFAELGHVLDEEHRKIVIGGPMTRSLTHLISVTGVGLTLAELSTMINARFVHLIGRGVPMMPGARRLLAELAAHRIPTALVSASHRHIIDTVLRSLGPENFALSVAGDELAHTKPHPEPYLTAAAGLGVDPSHCVVVEDTLTGVASAEAAGCRVIAVPSLVPIGAAPGRTVVDSLEQVDLTFLRSLMTVGH